MGSSSSSTAGSSCTAQQGGNLDFAARQVCGALGQKRFVPAELPEQIDHAVAVEVLPAMGSQGEGSPQGRLDGFLQQGRALVQVDHFAAKGGNGVAPHPPALPADAAMVEGIKGR